MKRIFLICLLLSLLVACENSMDESIKENDLIGGDGQGGNQSTEELALIDWTSTVIGAMKNWTSYQSDYSELTDYEDEEDEDSEVIIYLEFVDEPTQVYTERVSYTDRDYYEAYASEVDGIYEINQKDAEDWLYYDEAGDVLENLLSSKADLLRLIIKSQTSIEKTEDLATSVYIYVEDAEEQIYKQIVALLEKVHVSAVTEKLMTITSAYASFEIIKNQVVYYDIVLSFTHGINREGVITITESFERVDEINSIVIPEEVMLKATEKEAIK